MAAISNLDDVCMLNLRRVYDAEKRLTKALPKLAKSASSPELKQAFEDHLRETETHVDRAEQVFGLFDQPANADPSDTVKGIVKAGDDVIKLSGNRVPASSTASRRCDASMCLKNRSRTRERPIVPC